VPEWGGVSVGLALLPAVPTLQCGCVGFSVRCGVYFSVRVE
jgi:hypothetical protein